MKKRKNIITVAIDSPAAAGAGTQAKLIAREYNLFYLDTGKIYRLLAKLIIKNKKKLKYIDIKEKVKKIKIKKKTIFSDNFINFNLGILIINKIEPRTLR